MNDSYLPLSYRKVGPVPARAGLNQADDCRWEEEDSVWVCLLGVSGRICAGWHPPSSSPLDHGDLSRDLRMTNLVLLRALAGPGGVGTILLARIPIQCNLPNSREEAPSGHLWLGPQFCAWGHS